MKLLLATTVLLILVGCSREPTFEERMQRGKEAKECYKVVFGLAQLSGKSVEDTEHGEMLENIIDAANQTTLNSNSENIQIMDFLAKGPVLLADTEAERAKLLEKYHSQLDGCVEKFN